MRLSTLPHEVARQLRPSGYSIGENMPGLMNEYGENEQGEHRAEGKKSPLRESDAQCEEGADRGRLHTHAFRIVSN